MLKLSEYARYDAIGLAQLVAKKEVTPKELARTAAKAIEAVNPAVHAVVETYADRIDKLDERKLGDGPFRGVPFLIKDVFGHEKGRKIEFGSRLCEGMVAEASTYFLTQLQAAGVNIMGRTAAPEYSMSATTETVLYGNTSTPWRQGYSAGGSSGGAAAAVASGMVPIAHGSDIGGSIRIPASWCGGVGLKPSRGRVSIGPVVDEGGFGFSANFIQCQTVRDAAAMLDCVSAPQVGDPFVIPRPAQSYASLAKKKAPKLRIGLLTSEPFGVKTDAEVKAAVAATGKQLAAMGHDVKPIRAEIGGIETLRAMNELFFFAFDARLDGYGKRCGRKPGPKTLEPVILSIYEWSKTITPARFMASLAVANTARRTFAKVFTDCDVLLSPTTARVSEPWGNYHLSREGVDAISIVDHLFATPVQYTIPHNIMGTPSMSLPLAMHSTGVPIGVLISARPAEEHVLLQLATALEKAMPWRSRIPALHVAHH
jgi:amidase